MRYNRTNTTATPLLLQAQPWRFFFFWGANMVPMMPSYDKPALSFTAQVALLQQRGLIVEDTAQAESALAGISYYRLSAYWHPFRQRDATGTIRSELIPGTSFFTVLALYEFDRKLRLLVMDALERIEIAIRTAVTYQLGMAYGPFGHENAAHFHPKFDHAEWIRNLRQETTRSSDAFVTHYKTNYTGFPTMPIWMMTELLTLGALSRMYKGMGARDKKVVAAGFDLHPKRVQDWLHVLTSVRNVCAHHSRLWNRELAIRPQAMNEPEWQSPLLPGLDRLFCVLLMLRFLLKQSGNGAAWRDAVNALVSPIAEEPRWRNAMGLSGNWHEHPLWQ